ncbi:MAG: DUF4159 domain-containing protein [Maritimibacter sp.]
MFVLGPLGFAAPAILIALVVLPVLWVILRAVPPAPLRQAFPGVALLLGLQDEDSEAVRSPWWLLLLRCLAIGALIFGFAGPVLNPTQSDGGKGPLLVVVDDSFAAAPDWRARVEALRAPIAAAGSAARPVALVVASDVPSEASLPLRAAQDASERLGALTPQPLPVDHTPLLGWVSRLEGPFDTLWISDGLHSEARARLATALGAFGSLTVLEPPRARFGLLPTQVKDGLVEVEALRSTAFEDATIVVTGRGPDPTGIERELARVTMRFGANETRAKDALSLPPELRNRITRFQIEGQRSAGAVTLTDDSLKRRKVGLVSNAAREESLALLSPLDYLREALVPSAQVIEGPLEDVLTTGPDAIILVDVAALSVRDSDTLRAWVAEGGLLVRFAGPRLAALDGRDDDLLPVELRAGGRTVGGAMSWGEPRRLAPFEAESPFYGLTIPDDIEVTSQVLAQPGPDLAARTIAALADGTPLVTRKSLADGQVVLFHVTANAEWSSLPLSGLFVQMLERLAVSTTGGSFARTDLVGTAWSPVQVMDGFGALSDAQGRGSIEGAALLGPVNAALLPGLYEADQRRVAVNVLGPNAQLQAANWPAGITPTWHGTQHTRDLSGWVLLAGLLFLTLDILASLALTGRLRGRGRTGAAGMVALMLLAVTSLAPDGAMANDSMAIAAANDVTLAYVITGEGTVDRVSEAGLTGLSLQMGARTSVEPAMPVGVDLEADDLSLYPLLYWPIVETQKAPSAAAYSKLNAYMRAGGMIVFDTRDGDVAGFGSAGTPEAKRLRRLAQPLDIPPLGPIPMDHVVTRAFYLLTDFPGRYMGQAVWAEAAPLNAEILEGMPFRNLNDGVTPVMIGGNDWAAAWAVSDTGAPLFPVGRGYAGERQREMAYRFGVNLVMHVLTGNYKSDQVHVPALLERIGQ